MPLTDNDENLLRAIGKVAMAGEQAGFTIEQMIALLEAGLTIATLIELIDWRLVPHTIAEQSSRWIG